jgi:hypothetical protein
MREQRRHQPRAIRQREAKVQSQRILRVNVERQDPVTEPGDLKCHVRGKGRFPDSTFW